MITKVVNKTIKHIFIRIIFYKIAGLSTLYSTLDVYSHRVRDTQTTLFTFKTENKWQKLTILSQR